MLIVQGLGMKVSNTNRICGERKREREREIERSMIYNHPNIRESKKLNN